jgi:30S ribosomal protein S31
MGKGDIRTRRGKLFRGSFGNSRPKYKKPGAAVGARANVSASKSAATPAKPAREPAPKRRG